MQKSTFPWRALIRLTTVSAACLALTACASFSKDGGFGSVDQLTQARIGRSPSDQRTAEQSGAAAARVVELLKLPLSADSAVEVTLLGNRGLQADYAALGLAEADRVSAGRLANPSIRFGRLSGHGGVEVDRAVLFNVLGLLTMPWAQAIEQGRFEQAQWQAAADTLDVAAQARKAFFEAVAAQQLVGHYAQVMLAAEASNELAQRMVLAGNFNALAQMREQSFHSDARINLARAQHQAFAAREQLIRAIGWAGDPLAIQLPERLPDLPGAPLALKDAEQLALDTRLDVLMAKRSTEVLARALGLGQATRFINVLHVGYQNKSATGESLSRGFEVELELPLFDFGSTRTARAEALYMQSVNRTAEMALRARSEVREKSSAYRTAYELARHYRDEVVPLRRRISEENLLRYNGMLASVFDLLADSREQTAGVVGAVESLRDFWLAETQLQTAMVGGSPTGSSGVGVARAAGAGMAAGH